MENTKWGCQKKFVTKLNYFQKKLPNSSFGYNVRIIYIFTIKACFWKTMFFKYVLWIVKTLHTNYICAYMYIYQLFIYYMYTSWACFPLKCLFFSFSSLQDCGIDFAHLVMMATNMHWPKKLMVYVYMHACMHQCHKIHYPPLKNAYFLMYLVTLIFFCLFF
jgi:hypothetical protein